MGTDAPLAARMSGHWSELLSAFVTFGTVVVGAFFLGIGLWIFVEPHSFFDTLAVFRPYSRHFLHDAGAFQIGIGTTVLLALSCSDALLVVLIGVSVGSWLHVLSHVLDRRIGGRPGTDIAGLAALAALAIAAAVARWVLLERGAGGAETGGS